MRRVPNGMIRPGWDLTNWSLGLTYNETLLPDGTFKSYWREGAFYDLDMDDVRRLEEATVACNHMRIAAGDHIVGTCPRRHRDVRRSPEAFFGSVCTPESGCLLTKLGVPEYCHEQIIRTWLDGDAETWTHDDKDLDGRCPRQSPDFSPNIYSRYDFWYDGREVELLEINAQTPTSLVESAVIQWHWMEQTGQTRHPERQYNLIFDLLVGWEADEEREANPGAWRRNIDKLREARPWLPERPKVFFAYETSETSGEDRMNTALLMETCRLAGYPVELIAMSQIAWDTAADRIVFKRDPHNPDCPEEPIEVIFALYPWEWIWHEEIGKAAFRDMARPDKTGTVWIEPPYTAALWGNKGVLAVLWKLFGEHPEYGKYLLPAYFADDKPAQMTSYARKPIWGREGGNVLLVRDGEVIAGDDTGPYGAEGFVYQHLRELPVFVGIEGEMRPVVGSWVIDGDPAGIGIREGGLITNDQTSFIPHTIGSHL